MFDFIVWLVLFLIIAGIVLVLCYWVHLFTTRDQFERNELIDFYNIIWGELLRLTGQNNPFGAWMAMLAGCAVAWLLTLFGGWISPSVATVPDYASNLATNYFFQSILFVGVLHLMWPALQDYAYDAGGPGALAAQLVAREVPFMFSLGTGLAAMNLMNWGMYHQMNFLVILANIVSCAVYAGFRVYSYEPAADDPEGYGWQESYDDDYAEQPGESSAADSRTYADESDYHSYEPDNLDMDAPEI